MLLAYVRNPGEGKVAEDRVREAAGDHKLKVRERIGAGARLHLDTSSIDPAFYGDRLRLVCENGADIQLVVVHFSDRYLAVTGRISPLAA